MKMSENNDYIQLPPLKKDTPADVVAFMWEYMKVPEDSREKVKNLLKDANENGVKISHQAPHCMMLFRKKKLLNLKSLCAKPELTLYQKPVALPVGCMCRNM